jgi:3',5'-cyclic-AMP phosphodiesterase
LPQPEALTPIPGHSFADIHIAADRSQIASGVNMVEHFTIVTKQLLSLSSRPAGVFITGDCAYNSGQTADYATLAELLTPIRQDQVPIHIAIGNHDNRERFWDALKEQRLSTKPLSEKQVALIHTSRANWFVLDSLEKTLSTPGLIGREQLDWLAESLDANRRKPALVLVHHNPGLEGGNMGLKDTLALLEILRPRKQVKAYIYGHTHSWSVQQDFSGIHFVNLPAAAYVFRAGAPAGWVHAQIARKSMQLKLYCVDTSHKDHGQVVELKWRT